MSTVNYRAEDRHGHFMPAQQHLYNGLARPAEVKDQGHRRQKTNLDARPRHQSQPLWIE